MSTLSDLGTPGLLQQKAARIKAEMEAREASRQVARSLPVVSPAPEDGDSYHGCGPVGQGEYLVGPGDCMSSIAAMAGYFWETIWNDPANAELKVARGNPNALLPGDRVTIPAKSQKQGSGQTEARHRFVRRGEPTWLVLKLIDETGAPRPNLPYTLAVDGRERAGLTDGDGKLREPIPGGAAEAVLRIEDEDHNKEQYRLKLGHLDPAREVSGMQARLNNLGYGCGTADGKMGPRTLAALNRFRTDVGLPTGQSVDEQTLSRLEQSHDQMESIQRRKAAKSKDTLADHEWAQPPDSES